MTQGIYKHKNGYKRPPMTKEWRENIRKGHLGKKLSEKHKESIKKSLVGHIGDKARNWQGGKHTRDDGYVIIFKPKGYNTTKYALEHRLVVEKFLNRKLENWEIVHYKNSIKNDNRIENLEILIRKKHYGQIRCPYCLKEFLLK